MTSSIVLAGKSMVADAQALMSEINAAVSRQRKQRPTLERSRFFFSASQAESGKIYAICVDEYGREKIVKAEFITKGRGEYKDYVFFRRAMRGGEVVIHGIPNYSLIKETIQELREQD